VAGINIEQALQGRSLSVDHNFPGDHEMPYYRWLSIILSPVNDIWAVLLLK
jgi:hypothetical protein